MATQLPFSNQSFIGEIFGQRPELAMYGSIPNVPSFQRNLLMDQSGDFMKRFYGAAGRQLLGGQMPNITPQGFFGNMDFQKELFDMPRFTRGASSNFLNPRTRFLYGF